MGKIYLARCGKSQCVGDRTGRADRTGVSFLVRPYEIPDQSVVSLVVLDLSNGKSSLSSYRIVYYMFQECFLWKLNLSRDTWQILHVICAQELHSSLKRNVVYPCIYYIYRGKCTHMELNISSNISVREVKEILVRRL